MSTEPPGEEERFGSWLRRQREANRIPLRHVATLSGITPSYLSDIELGRRGAPHARLVRSLACHSGANLDEAKALAAKERADAEYVTALEAEVTRLRAERETSRAALEAYHRALAWAVAEGGWRLTYYERSGPCPDLIDTSDTFNPRLVPLDDVLAARAATTPAEDAPE